MTEKVVSVNFASKSVLIIENLIFFRERVLRRYDLEPGTDPAQTHGKNRGQGDSFLTKLVEFDVIFCQCS